MSIYNFDKKQMPDNESINNEWQERAKRDGLASVMRASHDDQTTNIAAANMETAILKFIDKNYGSLSGKRVLEIGTGIGRFTRPLAERAKSVTTVDMTSEMIERAKIKLKDLKNIEYIESEIKDLQFNTNEFDLVFDCWVLMHVLHEDDLTKSLEVIANAAPTSIICEYTEQGVKKVGRFSVLRSAKEYTELIKMQLDASEPFYYGDDRSDMMLFSHGF
jgi:2-polyprenyl-3-methyl-5-hydroxy-6-metoxy-1,4-benzoquinol methylase